MTNSFNEAELIKTLKQINETLKSISNNLLNISNDHKAIYVKRADEKALKHNQV